jgi:tRNA-specific 2-thiouridylase
MSKKRVLIGLSGGVDSAVSAYLLKKQGYDVVAGFMKNYAEESNPNCHTREDRNTAIQVAQHLGIQDFMIFDFRQEYEERIIDYIYDWYKAWITPNPDILCNNLVKFDLFLEKAMSYGFDYIATGHYARKIGHDEKWNNQAILYNTKVATWFQQVGTPRNDESFQLLRGLDHNKDQSYFLSGLNQYQLSKSLFPVGELSKPAVRDIAEKIWLPNANRKDSQGLCFIGNVPMREFLKKKLPIQKGDIILNHTTKIGEHDGARFWTIGQSRGLDLNIKAYVTSIDIINNIIHVSYEKNNPDLLHTQTQCRQWHWINPRHCQKWNNKAIQWNIPGSAGFAPDDVNINITVKIRYRQDPPVAARLQWDTDTNTMIVIFSEPQRGIAPGQSIVAYDGDVCLGGWIIV